MRNFIFIFIETKSVKIKNAQFIGTTNNKHNNRKISEIKKKERKEEKKKETELIWKNFYINACATSISTLFKNITRSTR